MNFHACNQGTQDVTMTTTSIPHKVSQTLLFLIPIDKENKIKGGQMCSLNSHTGSDQTEVRSWPDHMRSRGPPVAVWQMWFPPRLAPDTVLPPPAAFQNSSPAPSQHPPVPTLNWTPATRKIISFKFHRRMNDSKLHFKYQHGSNKKNKSSNLRQRDKDRWGKSCVDNSFSWCVVINTGAVSSVEDDVARKLQTQARERPAELLQLLQTVTMLIC